MNKHNHRYWTEENNPKTKFTRHLFKLTISKFGPIGFYIIEHQLDGPSEQADFGDIWFQQDVGYGPYCSSFNDETATDVPSATRLSEERLPEGKYF